MSIIRPLQLAIHGRLRSSDLVLPAPVVTKLKGNVVAEIEAALAELGLCVFVFPALPRLARPNSTGLFFEEIECRVRVIEMPLLNASAQDAYGLVENILFLLHGWDTGIAGLNPLHCPDSPVEDVDDDERVIFDIKALSSGGFAARPAHR